MYTFNQYFEEQRLAEERLKEEKRKAEHELEYGDGGWSTLKGNQPAVDDYIKWITK